MPEAINMTINTIIQVVEGLIVIFLIAKVFDTYNYVKKITENQDYENQRIYEIENQLEIIKTQQARIEQQIKEQNNDTRSDEKTNE